MACLQNLIDELESRQAVLDQEIEAEDEVLQELLLKGRTLSETLEAKREKRNHIAHAASNLRVVREIEENEKTPSQSSQTPEDPWGDT